MRTVSAAFLQAVTESHVVASRVDVLVNGEVAHTITGTVEGQVTLDQTASVRGRCELTIVEPDLIPTNYQALLTPYGNELRVYRGVRHPGGVDELVSLGVLRIDEVDIVDGAEGPQIQLSGLDRSARVSDARFEEPYQVAEGTNTATAIQSVLQGGWPDIPLSLTNTSATTPAIAADEGGDRWDFAQQLAKAVGMSLYFDGDGVCVTVPVSSATDSPVSYIAEGEGGVLIQASRSWSREGTYNRVVAVGENTSDDAPPARGVAKYTNTGRPTYYYGSFGRVPRFYASPFVSTDAQAQSAAEAMLSRELGTTQQVTFGALVNPALEPDDVVRITRVASGVDESHVIDSLTVPLGAGEPMTGRTRAVVAT